MTTALPLVVLVVVESIDCSIPSRSCCDAILSFCPCVSCSKSLCILEGALGLRKGSTYVVVGLSVIADRSGFTLLLFSDAPCNTLSLVVLVV